MTSQAIANSTLEVLLLLCSALMPGLIASGFVFFIHQAGKVKDEKIRARILTLVKYAQQVIPEKSDRYDYVATRASQLFPLLPATWIKEEIEAAVYQIKTTDITALTTTPLAPMQTTILPVTTTILPTTGTTASK